MKNVLCGLLAFGLLSCGSHESGKPDNELASNDFESLDGWMNGVTSPSLTKEKAHSGVYSVKVDPSIDYSFGYSNQLGRVSAERVTKVKLHAWVNLPNENTPVTLVLELKNPGDPKPVLWDGLDLLKEAKAKGVNKWIEVEKTVDLPESAAFTSQLGVSMWRGSSTQPAYLDDLQILRAN
jgi:hypothetical protein